MTFETTPVNTDKTAYLGNEKIKRHNVKETWTAEKLLEYQKCSNDPIYFIETYVKIMTLDHGLSPFTLWDFQKKLINHINNNRFSVILAARQSSKCVHNETAINIRNKKTGEVRQVSIGDFYEEQAKLSKENNV